MTAADEKAEGERWSESNRRFLVCALDFLRRRLRRRAARHGQGRPSAAGDGEEAELAAGMARIEAGMERPPALLRIAEAFGLSAFERDVLLLCAGIELAADIAPLCGEAQSEQGRPYPTFGLALAIFPDAAWSSLLPAAPLRHWRLIRRDETSSLTTSRLAIEERVLHALLGLDLIDPRLAEMIDPPPPSEGLFQSELAVAKRVAAHWRQAGDWRSCPAVQLCGRGNLTRRAVAAAACAALGLEPLILPARVVPGREHDLVELVRLCEREFVLGGRALFLDCTDVSSDHVERFIETIATPLIVGLGERRPPPLRAMLAVDIPEQMASERRDRWRALLHHEAGRDGALDHAIDKISAQFRLDEAQMRAVCTELAEASSPGEADEMARRDHATPPDASQQLWRLCRVQVRPRIEDLAARIDSRIGWDDLILPERQKEQLREIARTVAERFTVYERWGFAASSDRGLGVAALFAGATGTGKTMAAEVLASALDLDLYRIDLSAVVSKYIGETEKHLRRLFDAAEDGGAILLFDEADALFGKRSEVKDSHDRFANIEISYLLQRIESYGGLAILTTNMKEALDGAFLRRLRFVVDFPFPDQALRLRMWRRAFPAATPTDELRPERLASLNITGGTIRSIALGAAFLAASEGGPVTMARIASAAVAAYAKLGRSMSEAELRGLQ